MNGYRDPLYAASLDEWGEPLELKGSGTWLLVRSIPGSRYRDAMGIYPFTVARDWDAVCDDAATLPPDLVSLTLVADPFARDAEERLGDCFDAVRPFKEHHIADLRVPVDQRVTRHHRRRSRKALERVHVDVLERPIDHGDEWWTLYDNLVRRHGLHGVKAFSRRSFERQLQVPGLVVFRARTDDETTGMALWYQVGDVAYGHLVAMSDSGYANGSSYALDWFTGEWFEERCRWLDFGGGAGAELAPSSGLDEYKRGWCTDSAHTWLCTRVLDRAAYDELTARSGSPPSGYFPAYRSGELV